MQLSALRVRFATQDQNELSLRVILWRPFYSIYGAVRALNRA